MTQFESDGMLAHLIMFVIEEHVIRDQQHLARAKLTAVLDAWAELKHGLDEVERRMTDRRGSMQKMD